MTGGNLRGKFFQKAFLGSQHNCDMCDVHGNASVGAKLIGQRWRNRRLEVLTQIEPMPVPS